MNDESSIPKGLYWKVDKPLAISKAVVFCPPNLPEFQEARSKHYISDGSCPDNFDNMMLKIAAKFKYKVTINEHGVYVNDVLYPNSKPLSHDQNGLAMPALSMYQYELKENELLLMSDSDKSFDGRYFGVINVEQIGSVIIPFVTF